MPWLQVFAGAYLDLTGRGYGPCRPGALCGEGVEKSVVGPKSWG